MQQTQTSTAVCALQARLTQAGGLVGGGRQRPAYLIRSAPGWRPRPDGESAGTAGPSGGCSGRGDGKGGASSADGAGGCMVGGAQDAFRPAEEPLRATHDVSMTLTPMLARDRETQA